MTNEEIKYCKDCKKNNCGNILCRAKVNYIKELENENKELKEKIKFIYQFNMSDMVSREAQCRMIEKTFGDMFDCYGEYKNDNKRNNINDNDCYIGYSAK